MKPVRKVVATVGKYVNNQGEEKNRYLNMGTMFKRDDGSLCIKLESMPVGEFNGWVNLYPLDEEKKPAPRPTQQVADEDIPF